MKRQTYLSICKGDPAANEMAVSSQAITNYFDLLEKTLKDNNLLNKPAQIYNVDETGMAYEHRGSQIKAQTMVVACVNAIGQAIPPYVIYNAKTLNPEWIKDGLPGTKYANSENGWINTDIFKHWFNNHFLTHAVSSRPLLLILDGHKTYYQPHVCQEAKKSEVIIFCLPPSTHVSQRLGMCVFKPLKTEWNKATHMFQSKNPGVQITKYNFSRLLKEAWENAMLSSNICVGFRNAGIYPLNRDKVWPTTENDELLTGITNKFNLEYICVHTTYLDGESDESSPLSIHGDVVDDDDNPSCDISDMEACSDEYLENEELFNRQYEEGYNIYSEPYAKWLLKNHPRETPTDWIIRLEQGIIKWYQHLYIMRVVSGVTKSKDPKNSSVHSDSSMVPHGSQQSDITLEEERDANEQLYQKRFEEGYDIYDEEYVKWMMINHPNDVPSEWLTEVSSSSKMPATTTASQPDKSTKSDKIVLNYSSIYEALNRPRKRSRSYDSKPGGSEDTGHYISKYLHQAVVVPKQKKKQIRITGARVLTSEEAIKIMQDKEDEKKEKALEKEKRKEERERKKAEKMAANKKNTRKGNGKATVKDTRDLNTCPICMQWFDEVGYDMGDWIECHCKQWIHENCIDYDIIEPFICPNCV